MENSDILYGKIFVQNFSQRAQRLNSFTIINSFLSFNESYYWTILEKTNFHHSQSLTSWISHQDSCMIPLDSWRDYLGILPASCKIVEDYPGNLKMQKMKNFHLKHKAQLYRFAATYSTTRPYPLWQSNSMLFESQCRSSDCY